MGRIIRFFVTRAATADEHPFETAVLATMGAVLEEDGDSEALASRQYHRS
jgi:hypothetical protein